MKNALSLLITYVMLQTQTWALTGGPVFGGSAAAISGTYSGVLLPELDPAAVAAATGADPGAVVLDVNALGLFSLGIATEGPSFGVCAFFNKGEVFTGKMAGIADPENGTLKALLEASSLRILSVSTGSGDAVGLTGTDVRTVGRMDAEITDPSGDSAISAQRLEGTATLSSFSDANRNPDGSPILSNTIVFNVDGFKQTENVTTPGDIDFGVSATR